MFIDPAETALVAIDLQEKLAPAMAEFEPCAKRAELLISGARELRLDTIVTEQYPKGLGATLPRFASLLTEGTPIIAKTGFSVFEEPAFRTALAAKTRRTLVFCGIESHVCVLQSVLDAIERGFRVCLAADAVTSRKVADRELALAAARAAGATVVSAEALLFMMLRDAKNPAFKAISKLVR
jgi:nicotinamidase-related amidase